MKKKMELNLNQIPSQLRKDKTMHKTLLKHLTMEAYFTTSIDNTVVRTELWLSIIGQIISQLRIYQPLTR